MAANEQAPGFYRYNGPSMWPVFQPGDLLEVEPVELAQLRAGDCIIYRDPEGDRLITHRVSRLHADAVETRGDAFGKPDDQWVVARQLVGRVIGRYRLGSRCLVRGALSGRMRGVVNFYVGRLDPQRTSRGGRLARRLRALLQRAAAGLYRRGTVRPFAGSGEQGGSYWLVGRRPWASYDPGRGAWVVPWPQSLLIDPARLPDQSGKRSTTRTAEATGAGPTG